MSVVYRAHDATLDRKVAVKLLAPDLAEDDRFRERFLRESKLAASIEHPHIIPVYEAGEHDGALFIATRYVDGTDLKALLRREGALDPPRVLTIVQQLADALDTAHSRGLVHRDVKPSNVLVAPGDHVYLADFGLTKSTSDRSALTTSGQILGTVDYVAPEQIEGKPVDGRADVYSLGCLLYECLTGSVPYARDSELATLWAHVQQEPPRATGRRPELPTALDDVIAKALAKDPDQRYGTARELVEAARDAFGEPSPPARRMRLALVAIAVVAATAIAAVLLTRGGSSVQPLTNADGVARIDPSTNRLAAAIAVGNEPVDVATGFGHVWVANSADVTISRVDPKAERVDYTIPLGGPGDTVVQAPLAVATGEDGVWVVEGPDAVVAQTRFPLSGRPLVLGSHRGTIAIDVAIGARAVWVATVVDERVWRIDPAIHEAVASIPLGYRPSSLAFGGGKLWISTADGTLLSIDPRTNRVGRTVRLPFVPGGLAFADGSVWLSNTAAGTVVRYDAGRRTGVVRIGGRPSGLASGYGSLWVANSADGTVSRVDPAVTRVVATVNVGPQPEKLAAGEGGVWVVTRVD
jgi:YVTN family beta-propeller protein